MRFEEKLRKQMLLKGFNQQRLARTSRVSDSEVSRILGGKSQPGLENAMRLAEAVGVSLDYLANDALEEDPSREADATSEKEREVLRLARLLGLNQCATLLENARLLGYEVANRRLLGQEKPLIEVGDGNRVAPIAPPNRASSA